ncbi:MAG: type I methionyl aminopeptidase [Candidatus Zambryskibacteria bacterium]|nr:type I methionyl aminopeptidase [Candidatus Zambryskibacteria bacterium]
MISIKTPEEIEILKEGGRRLGIILRKVSEKVKVGVSTQELEDYARKLIHEGGDTASFLNYTPHGAKRPFPAAICVSINEEIVHGIPNEEPYIIQDGDLVSLDLGITHQGLITDSAVTLCAGNVSDKDRKLVENCREALFRGIKAAHGGTHIGDIGHAIESFARPLGYGISEGLAGHGVGYKVHEDPFVPNEGERGRGELLRPGMVLALEPMLTLGTDKIILDADGYTYKTTDGSRAAHFEHSIVITDSDPIILTK